MIPKRVFFPADFEGAARRLVDAARGDPAILVLDRGLLGALLVFCEGAEESAPVLRAWRIEKRLSADLATIELAPSARALVVHPEGAPASRRRLAALLAPLAARFERG